MANETIVRVTADASGYTSEMEKAKRSAQSFISSQEEAAKRTQAAQAAVAEAVANGSDASTRKINAFMQSLTKQAETAGKARSELLQMQAAQLGVTSSAQAYIDQIKKAEEGTHNFSMQTAGARRELLVLAHEASQGNWKNFGGSLLVLGERTDALGAIFSATGVTIGLTVAALGALAVAAIKGADDQKQLNAALVLTNNYAGLTSQSLQDMAQRIAGSSGESLGKASDVLMGLAQSGRYTSSEMEGLGNIIVRTAKISGASLEDVSKSYEKLAEDPAKWAYEHNQSMHFMDVATYQHIQALQESGDKHKAVQAIIEAATGQVESSSTQHLSVAAKAWHDLTDGVQKFWEGLKKGLNDGATYQDKIDVLMGERKDIQGNSFAAKRVAEIDQQVAALQELQRMQTRSAESQARQDQINQAGIEAARNIDKMRDQFMSNAQRRNKELAQLEKDRKAIIAGGGTMSDETYNSIASGIKDKYKDPAPKAYQDDAATKFIQQIRDLDAATRAALSSNDKLTGAEKMQAEFLQKIADLKGKSILTADQKSLLANQDKIKAALDQYAADEKSLRLKEEIQKLDERSAQINQEIATFQTNKNEGYSRTLDAFGQGKDAQAQVAEMNQIQREYQRYQDQLTKATPKELLGSKEFQDEQAKISAGLSQSMNDYRKYYDDLKEKQTDRHNGASQAFADYIDSARNVAGQTESLFTNAFKGMEDSIVSFVTTGKLSFSSLAQSIIADLIRIQTREQMSGLAGTMMAGLGSLFGGGGSLTVDPAGMSTNNTGMSLGALGLSGGRASGGPVSAGNLYRVNEMGPELYSTGGKTYLMAGGDGGYVTPVSQGGSSAGGGVNVQATVYITQDGTKSDVKSDSASAKAIGDSLNQAMDTWAQRSMRDGGVLSKMMRG